MDTVTTEPERTFTHGEYTIIITPHDGLWIVDVLRPDDVIIYWESGFASADEAAQAGRRVAEEVGP